MPATTVLETERLRLVPWRAEQLDDVVRLHSDPAVAKYYSSDGAPWSREKSSDRLDRWLAEFRDHRMGKHRVERKSDGALLGRAGYSLHEPTAEPEIGYALFPEFWGKGYATEAAAGLRDWIFRETNWDHFIGFAHDENLASQAVLRRIGMSWTHGEVAFGMPCQFFVCRRPAS